MSSIDTVDLAQYDFLDFGSSKGASTDFAQHHLGGKRGLGLDFDPRKVEEATQEGYECVCTNLIEVDLPEKCVDFVIVNHLLEHLHSIPQIRKVIENALRSARNFVFIGGPWFDADEYLSSLGFKFYWSDWHHHRVHVTCELLTRLFRQLGVKDYAFLGSERIYDSMHSTIHPFEAPPNQHHYKEAHGFKPYMRFSKPLFREMMCLVYLQDFPGREGLLTMADGVCPIQPLFEERLNHEHLYTKDDIINDQIVLSWMLRERLEKERLKNELLAKGIPVQEEDVANTPTRLTRFLDFFRKQARNGG